MNYYEVNFNYESAIEPSVVSDILAAELGEIGFESFTETDKGLQAYIQDKLYSETALKEKLNDFPIRCMLTVVSHWVKISPTKEVC